MSWNFTSSLRDTTMHELGGGTTRHMRSVVTGILLPSLRTRVHTPMERINIWSGEARCLPEGRMSRLTAPMSGQSKGAIAPNSGAFPCGRA